MRKFPVLGFPSSCGGVQPQRTNLVIRTGHNLLNKNKSVEKWRGTAQLICAFVFCLFVFFCFVLCFFCKNRVSHVYK